MSINKNLFSNHLKNKDYNYCIQIIRKEIISILSDKIREKNPQFTYTTVNSLKVNSIKYLSELEQNVAIQFYTLSFNEDASEYELSVMLDLYKNLIQ